MAAQSNSVEDIFKHNWTLWYYEHENSKTWEECQHEISTFKTVDDFWFLFKSIKSASSIKLMSDYAFFKDGFRPIWEDEVNSGGGRWIIMFDKEFNSNTLNHLWLELLLLLFHESLQGSAIICGAVFSNRPKHRKIALWIKHGSPNMICGISQEIRTKLHLDDSVPIVFEYHNKSPRYNQKKKIKSSQWCCS